MLVPSLVNHAVSTPLLRVTEMADLKVLAICISPTVFFAIAHG